NDTTNKIEVVSQRGLNQKENYSIRQSLHDATLFGKIKLTYKTNLISPTDALGQTDRIVSHELKSMVIDAREKGLPESEIVALISKKQAMVRAYEELVATRYEKSLESLANVSSEKIISEIE